MTELYLPPTIGEIQQGDIFEGMPSVVVEARPLRVARHWRTHGDRDEWVVHREGENGPPGGFKWRVDQGGEEALLVHAFVDRAMVVSHDCEIENDPRIRTIAMVRPADQLNEDAQERLFSGREEDVNYAIFPLEAQTDEPKMERAFVDFRRLTTVRPAVLEAGVCVASLSGELRMAIAEAFRRYLFRRVETPAGEI